MPAMLAIMDVMRTIPNDVPTVAFGMAASAGQFLLSAGTRGKRAALPHAKILMHQGSAGTGGTAVDVEIQAEDLRHTRDTVLGLIAEHTGQPLERVVADSQRDRWYTAEEAVAYGFVDHVVDRLDAVCRPRRYPRGWDLDEQLPRPVRRRAQRGRRALDGRLQQVADRPHRLRRHRDRRRRRQRAHRSSRRRAVVPMRSPLCVRDARPAWGHGGGRRGGNASALGRERATKCGQDPGQRGPRLCSRCGRGSRRPGSAGASCVVRARRCPTCPQ